MEKGLLINVLRGPHGDCTNGGVSSHTDTLVLVGPGIDEVFEATPAWPIVRLVKGPYDSLRLVPDAVKGRWFQFGGNFGWSSDSRFVDAVRAMGGDGNPIKIFDRVE